MNQAVWGKDFRGGRRGITGLNESPIAKLTAPVETAAGPPLLAQAPENFRIRGEDRRNEAFFTDVRLG